MYTKCPPIAYYCTLMSYFNDGSCNQLENKINHWTWTGEILDIMLAKLIALSLMVETLHNEWTAITKKMAFGKSMYRGLLASAYDSYPCFKSCRFVVAAVY